MIPRNAVIYKQDPDGGPNIRMTEEETAQFWDEQDAHEARFAGREKTPRSVSDRQFFQQLAIVGVISEAEAEAAVASGKVPAAMLALVDKLPQAERFGARMMLKGATVFERYSALIATLAALYRWDAAQTDSLFRKAAKL